MDAARNSEPLHQCEGKEPFSSPQVAAKVARRMTRTFKRQHGKGNRPLQSYRCPVCSSFHVGRAQG